MDEHGEINEDYLRELQNQGERMVRSKKKQEFWSNLQALSGVSFINLKRHGQWKSNAVVEGYIANSKPLRREREECLLPASLEIPEPEAMKGSNGLNTFNNLQGFSQL